MIRSTSDKIRTEYGFIADPSLTCQHNASLLLAQMPAWYYFDRPHNIAFHNLTDERLPYNLKSLLGLSLKFVPNPTFTPPILPSLERFQRDLLVKTFFNGKPLDNPNFEPKYHIRSAWSPKHHETPSTIHNRLQNFESKMNILFSKHRGTPNLLPLQSQTLKYLQTNQEKYIVAVCDKNLGPALIRRSTYIDRTLNDHLLDTSTYRPLSQTSANHHMLLVKGLFKKWIQEHTSLLTNQERKFFVHHIDTCRCAFSKFYITMKVHKSPWKTRPIASYSGSLLYSLGVWIDRQLQVFAKQQQSYFKNSAKLKELLSELGPLPPNARIFTADAISMYTNIKTQPGIRRISNILLVACRNNLLSNDRRKAIIQGLRLIMDNNLFQFGDTYWLQIDGTAMGAPPAPPWATLTFGVTETAILRKNRHPQLHFYKRFIDDVIGIWLVHPDPVVDKQQWSSFTKHLNSYDGLVWEVEKRALMVNYMDLKISILPTGFLHTNLYEKALNLYLYLPPHSTHPKSLLSGLIAGSIHRILSLCTDFSDQRSHINRLYLRLCARGYDRKTLRSMIETTTENRMSKIQAPKPHQPSERIFFHIPYHADNPPARAIQQTWQDCIVMPKNDLPFHCILGRNGSFLQPPTLTVAYSRMPTLGNILTYRNFERTPGPTVSSIKRLHTATS